MANENRSEGEQGKREDDNEYGRRRASRLDAWHAMRERANRLPASGAMMSYRQWAMDLIDTLFLEIHGEEYKAREEKVQTPSHSHHSQSDVRMIEQPPLVVGGQIGPGVIMVPAPGSEGDTKPGEQYIHGGPPGQVGVRHVPGNLPPGGGTHPVPTERGGTVDVANRTTGVQEVGPGEQSDAVRHAEDEAFHNQGDK